MDGYFDALDVHTTSGDGDSNAALLDGVSQDLRKGANDALETLDLLKWGVMINGERTFDELKKDTADLFREFSETDIDYASDSGLQKMIEAYESLWHTFQDNSKTPLDRSLVLLLKWRGEGAESAKTYVQGLANTYARVGTKLTVLESDLVAAREAVAMARADLTKLAASFKATAVKFVQEQERQSDATFYKVLAAGFAGAITGVLTVVTGGIAAGAAAATWFSVAQGAVIAGQSAGAMVGAGLSAQADVTGDSAWAIYKSFREQADNIREAMFVTSDALVARIHTEINDLPIIPDPPDVSPGSSFDPSNFETDRTSKETEKRVRDKDVDIQPDGRVTESPKEMAPLPLN